MDSYVFEERNKHMGVRFRHILTNLVTCGRIKIVSSSLPSPLFTSVPIASATPLRRSLFEPQRSFFHNWIIINKFSSIMPAPPLLNMHASVPLTYSCLEAYVQCAHVKTETIIFVKKGIKLSPHKLE